MGCGNVENFVSTKRFCEFSGKPGAIFRRQRFCQRGPPKFVPFSDGLVMSQPDDLVYAGELEPTDVWERLKSEPRSSLIDCRTIAEWSYVGVPDLSSLGQEIILVEWQRFPDMSVNPGFVDSLKSELEARGLGRDTPLYILCRSGVRSRSAAASMTGAGYSNSYNVLNGFEGNLDDASQRGHLAGWKKSNLPWRQK